MVPAETGLPLFCYEEFINMSLGSFCPKNGNGYITDLRERELIEEYNQGGYVDVGTHHDEAKQVK